MIHSVWCSDNVAKRKSMDKELTRLRACLELAEGALEFLVSEFSKHGNPTYERSNFSKKMHYSPIAVGIKTQVFFKALETLSEIARVRKG